MSSMQVPPMVMFRVLEKVRGKTEMARGLGFQSEPPCHFGISA